MTNSTRWAGALLMTAMLATTGCGGRGFRSPERLDREGRGPAACYAQCQQMGMQMAALVLVQNSYSGCVCVPPTASVGGNAAPQLSAVAAGHVAIEIAQQQSRQQAAAAARR